MSTPLSPRARWAVRTATAVATAVAVTIPSAAVAAEAPSPRTPWISVSDVLAASLERMSAAEAEASAAELARAKPASARQLSAAPVPSEPRILATVEGVEILEPSTRTLEIGFHEGSTRGLPLTPVGRLLSNETNMNAPEDRDGPGYRLMSSRGRAAGASSAVDLAVPKGEEVLAVATGTVKSVSRYALYGSTSDVLVEIVPAGKPGLNVQVFHVEGVKVQAGDRVVAGETVVAESARQLPFPSQIDRHVGSAGPHVHVQVLRG